MKKISYLFILQIAMSFSVNGQCDIRMYDIYTPKGSPVVTFLMCESSIEKRKSLDRYYAQRYPHAVQIKTYDNCSSTRKFNCHGYAWLRVEQNIDRWIGTGWSNDVVDPEKIYITDGSYTEVSQETYPGKVFWASGDHTAVTTEQQEIFISKWNEWPLMKHAWNYSPFGSNNLKYYKKSPLSLQISGPSTICNQATYTIENLPPGATVQWTTSSNISIISGQGTSSVTVTKSASGIYGQGSISATISQNTTILTTVSRLIDYVGTPVVSYISGQSYLSVGSSGSYTAEPSIMASGIQYKWTVSPSSASSSPWNNTNSITFYNEGTYNVACQIISPCGYGSAASMIVTVVRNGGGYFSLYPNPATDIVIVQLDDEYRETSAASDQDAAKNRLPGTAEIQLWNASVLLRTYKTDQNTFQIPVSGLPAGIYFVRVVKDGKTETKKLIVR